MIVAVEGIDGAGKNTLVQASTARLQSQGLTVATFAFPAYGQTLYADLADAALHGRLGDAANSAWGMALLFALDRKERREALVAAAASHDVVIIDRYVASNAAYSRARTGGEDIVTWIEHTEFFSFELPLPDVQVCLDTAVSVAADRAQSREAHDAQRSRDVYERDASLQERTLAAYRELAARNWVSPWLLLDSDATSAERLSDWIVSSLSKS